MNVKKHIGENYSILSKEYVFILFLSICSIMGLSLEIMPLAVLPIGLMVGLILLLNMKLGYYLAAFFLPLSINIKYDFLGISLYTPAEPLLLILSVVTIYQIAVHGLPISYIKHPLSILFIAFSCLIVISSIFSTNVIVSLRIVLQTLAYIIPAYWGVLYLSKDDNSFIRKFFILPILSFSMICFVNFLRHGAYNFNRSLITFIVRPVFSDHTIYATFAALMIPLAFVCMAWFFGKDLMRFLFFMLLFLACTSGLVLSYSRAAIISVLAALGLYIFIRLKLSWWILFALFCAVVLFTIANQDTIQMSLKRNQSESKARKTNFSSQVKSITNVSNDVSNLERINRWNSAIRMIHEKPFLGYGYGMYQYEYFPFQKESELTTISIRNPQAKYLAGTGGTAHSEYLLLSSENGILVGLTYIALLFSAVLVSVKTISGIPSNSFTYYFSLGIIMSITTYIVHGFFNNFLDTSKISFLFFALLASITSISIKRLQNDTSDIVSI